MSQNAIATRTRRPADETRQHILDIAEDLFYWRGIHATGVDTIAAEAAVAPATLYRLFGSKDDLVAAYVDRYATGYREWIAQLTAATGRPARERILGLLDGLTAATGPESFRGCPFMMALAEYPDPGSAANASARAVKAWVCDTLHELARQLPLRDPADADTLADQLTLVVEGLYASTAALGTAGPARHAPALAAVLIDAASRPVRRGHGTPRPGQ